MAQWNQESQVVYKTDADSFKAWITKEVENLVEKLPNLGYEETDPNLKVAITTLAFKNGHMIDLLK